MQLAASLRPVRIKGARATRGAGGGLRNPPVKSCVGRARGVPCVSCRKEERDQPLEWASRLFITLPLSVSLFNFLEQRGAGEQGCINLLTIVSLPIYKPEDTAVRGAFQLRG